MASNQTANFGLNQWSAEDKVLREEFNADNAKVDAALYARPQITMGSYVGTGDYGSATPNSLNFDFQPLAVAIVQNSTTSTRPGVLLLYGQTASAGFGSISASAACMEIRITWSKNGLSWYSKESALDQLNTSDQTYHYFALGK